MNSTAKPFLLQTWCCEATSKAQDPPSDGCCRPSVHGRCCVCRARPGDLGTGQGGWRTKMPPYFNIWGNCAGHCPFPTWTFPRPTPKRSVLETSPSRGLSRHCLGGGGGGGGGAQPSSSPALLSTTPARPSSPTNPAPPSLPVRTPDKPQALNMALPRVRIKNKIVQNGIIPVQMLKVSSISPCDWTEKCSIDLSTCTHALLSVCPCGRGLIRWGLTDMCSAHYIT